MSLIGAASGRCLTALDDFAQFGGSRGEPRGGVGGEGGFARQCKFQFAGKLGASRKAEGAEYAGQLVRGGLCGFALLRGKTAAGDGRDRRFENGYAFNHFRKEPLPQFIQCSG